MTFPLTSDLKFSYFILWVFYLFVCFGIHPGVLKAYSWFNTQELFLVGSKDYLWLHGLKLAGPCVEGKCLTHYTITLFSRGLILNK